MKKRLLQISKALLLCSMLYFSSCVNDDFIENQYLQNEIKISSRYISFNQVKGNKNVFEKFKNVEENIKISKKNSSNQNARFVYLSQFDFSIDTDQILLIEKEDYKSYTFPIYRDNETDKTENLVITEFRGLVNSYISKYNLTKNDKAILENNQYLNLTDITEIKSLEARSGGEPCYEQISIPIEWNSQGQVTVSMYFAVEVPCPDESGSSGSDGSSDGGDDGSDGGEDSSGSGLSWGGFPWNGGWNDGEGSDSGVYNGGAGSTGSPDGGNTYNPLNPYTSLIDADGNPIITSPVLSLDNDPRAIKHLISLVENMPDGTKTNIKTRIDQLNTNRLTSFKENGYMFDNNQNTHLSYNQGSNWTAWADPGTSYFILLHMHQDNYIPEGKTTSIPTNVAPSDTDVVGLLKLLDYTGNRNSTSIIVSRQGTFAIRVNDKSKANDAYDAIINNKEIGKDFSNKYDELVMKPYETIPLYDDAVMDGFIEFINTHLVNGQSMGLSFYQAVYDSQGNIINWVKL